MRVARRHERQRLEDRPDHRGIVLAESARRDEGAHVQKTVRLSGAIAIDDREVRSDGLRGIERDWQRKEETARGRLERGARTRQQLLGQLFERALAGVQQVGDVHVHIACAVSRVQFGQVFERSRDLRDDVVGGRRVFGRRGAGSAGFTKS